jgi:hypothetical protein
MNRRNNNNYRNYDRRPRETEKQRIEREREEALKLATEKTDKNFPSLGKVSNNTSASGWGSKKFTELVSDWKEEDDLRKDEEKLQKLYEEEMHRREKFRMPYFSLHNRFVEPEDDYSPSDYIPEKEEEKELDTDTWTTIDTASKRNAQLNRRRIRHEEKLKRMDDGQISESSSDDGQQDDSCWNQVAPMGKSYD